MNSKPVKTYIQPLSAYKKFEVTAENGGEIVLGNPFGMNDFKSKNEYEMAGNLIKIN